MTNKELYKYMDDLLKMHLEEQSKQNCIYICNKLTKWFATNAVTVNVNNWLNDYSQGYDTAKEDIKDFCKKEIVKNEHEEDIRDMYNTGYRYALCKVLEHLERM